MYAELRAALKIVLLSFQGQPKYGQKNSNFWNCPCELWGRHSKKIPETPIAQVAAK
jgi:hypothetical protein